MKYVAIIVVLLLMIVGGYLFLSKTDSTTTGDSTVGETSAEKAAREAREAAEQLQARKDATANRPELYVVERYLSIDADQTWSQNVEKGASKLLPYKANLLKTALKAAETDGQISKYQLVKPGFAFSESLFKIKIDREWKQFNINDLIAEYTKLQAGKLH
jgi:hypothetical protein